MVEPGQLPHGEFWRAERAKKRVVWATCFTFRKYALYLILLWLQRIGAEGAFLILFVLGEVTFEEFDFTFIR